MSKTASVVAAVFVLLLLNGCMSQSAEDPSEPSAAEPSAYDLTLVPAEAPTGLTALRAISYADPEVSGQTLLFSFGADTLYSCLRPHGARVSAVDIPADRRSAVVNCPGEGKRIMKIVDIDGTETVYSVDAPPVEGKGSTAPETNAHIVAFLAAEGFRTNPRWLEGALNDGAR